MGVNGPARSESYSKFPSLDRKAFLTEKQHSTAGLWQPRRSNIPDVKLDPWHGSQLLVLRPSLGRIKEEGGSNCGRSASLQVNYDSSEEQSQA